MKVFGPIHKGHVSRLAVFLKDMIIATKYACAIALKCAV